MRVLIYLRVSTEQQFRGGNSIPAQKEACLNYIQRCNHEINPETDIYVDGGITGRTDDRQAFQDVMERLKSDASIEGVVAYDISRIFRNVVEYLSFKDKIEKYGKKFLSVSENFIDDTPAGWFSETMMAVFAEFRSRQDGDKIRMGMRRKAQEGRYPGFAPFGYCNKREPLYGNKDRRWMEVNPTEAIWVKEMFTNYATGQYSLESLTDELNERGIPTRNGKPLARSTLEKMLKNEIYMGYIKWGGVDNPNGQHEKLVSEDLFYKVQLLRQEKNYGATRRRKHRFLLNGVAYCGECGSRVGGAYHKHRSGIRYAYYSCHKSLHGHSVSCGQSSIRLEETEKQFAELVKTIQISDTSAEKIRAKILAVIDKDKESQEDLKRSLVSRIDDIQVKQKALLEKYVDGKIEDAQYESYKTELKTKEMKLKAELSRVEGNLSSIVGTIETAIGLTKNCYSTYKRATYEQKIMLAQTFFKKITIKDKKILFATLNHPFVLICKDRTSKSPYFQLDATGGDGRN